MNLTLSRRGDYVIRAALCLAESWDGHGAYRKIKEVADAMDLPLSYTPQVLGLLAKAGLAEAKAGRDGGYRLTRPPAKISVLEVVEAAEGHLVAEHCALRGGPCHWEDMCALHPTWERASEAIRSTLGRTTLAAIAQVDKDLLLGKPVPSVAPGHRKRDRQQPDDVRSPARVTT